MLLELGFLSGCLKHQHYVTWNNQETPSPWAICTMHVIFLVALVFGLTHAIYMIRLNCFGEELEEIHTCLKLQQKQLVCSRTIHGILDTWHDWIFPTKRCSVRQQKRICFHGYPIVLYSLWLGSYHVATYSKRTGATPQSSA